MVTVPNKHTLFGSIGEFSCIVWSEKGPTSATESFEKIVIRFCLVTKEMLEWGGIVNDTSG
jgi:hypothetical protein